MITATNYQEAAQALQDAGYATDPGYAQNHPGHRDVSIESV